MSFNCKCADKLFLLPFLLSSYFLNQPYETNCKSNCQHNDHNKFLVVHLKTGKNGKQDEGFCGFL